MRRPILFAVAALGVSCVMTQLVLMRELLCALTGNELVLGVVLGNWFLIMGAGAWLGRQTKKQRDTAGMFLWLQILVAVVPVAQVFALRVLRNEVFDRGAAVGLGATVVASFVVLLPNCLAAGCLLTLACSMDGHDGNDQASAGRVYIADCLGSILGGALFSLVLLWVLNSFALLACAGLLNLAVAAWLAWRWRRKGIVATAMATAALLAFVSFVLNTDAVTTKLQHPGEDVLFRGNSPYGPIVVTRAGNQINFFQNGSPVVSTHNTAEVEEAAHYAMAQRPDARRVLLIGGGVAGTANELLKYPAEITCVELDPLFLDLGRRFLPHNLSDPLIRVVNTDGRRFVQSSRATFDVIIIDLADPTTAQLNRFHTSEFLAEAKNALTPHGVLALAVGRYENFVSPELAAVLATTHKTFQGVFANILVLPGGRVFFLASDGPLGMDIASRLEKAHISTRFVNRHYLDAMLTPDRLADMQRAVTQDASPDRDFSPVLYFQCLRLWTSQFNPRFGGLEILLALAFAIYVARLRGAAITIFASGFAASSLEVVLPLAFQALCGSLYYQLGIIVTVFMAGLAAGAAWANRLRACFKISLASSATAIAVLALLLPLVLALLSHAAAFRGSNLPVQITIAFLTFILAAPVGAQFPLANQLACNASRLYTADFMGAFLGALLASTLLIPTIGVTGVCLLAAALNALAAAALYWRKAVT